MVDPLEGHRLKQSLSTISTSQSIDFIQELEVYTFK